MLGAGAPVPSVRVWDAPGEEAADLRELVGDGRTLVCFYPFDWSPG
jgi:peroxiredoxin